MEREYHDGPSAFQRAPDISSAAPWSRLLPPPPIRKRRARPGEVLRRLDDPSWFPSLATVIVASTLAARLIVLVAFWNGWHWQEGRVHDGWNTLGINLAESGTFGFQPGEPTLRRGPAFQVAAAGLYVLFGTSYAAWSAALILIDGVTCFLILSLARRRWGERAALLAGLYFAVHLPLAYYTAQIEQFTVVLPLLFIWVFLLASWEREFSARWLPWALGLVSGLLVLNKSVYIIFPAAGVAAALWLGRKRLPVRSSLARAGIVLIAASAVVSPWLVRNTIVSGGRILPVQLLLWENVWANIHWDELDRSRGMERRAGDLIEHIERRQGELIAALGGPPRGLSPARREVAVEGLYREAFLEWLPAHPARYAAGVAKNLWQFWFCAENRRKTLLFLGLQALPLAAAAAGAIALLRHRRMMTAWPALLAAGLLWLQYAAVLAMGRYSLDLVPVLGILFGVGADTHLSRRIPRPAPLSVG